MKFTAHRSVKEDLKINLGLLFVSNNAMTILFVVQFLPLFAYNFFLQERGGTGTGTEITLLREHSKYL